MVQRTVLMLGALALAAALALVIAGPGGASPAPLAQAAKSKTCGTMEAPDGAGEYRFKVTRGSVTCHTARRVLKRFLRTNMRSSGWDCRNGGGGSTWTAACGSPYRSIFDTFRDADFKKVIKAYFDSGY